MMKIAFCKDTRDKLLEIGDEKGIYIEGNILKLIDPVNDKDLEEYVKKANKLQKEKQRKRLDVTKQVQTQNKQLTIAKEEIQEANSKLEEALTSAERSKENALKDLDILQKKTQFELVTVIVKISLAIIIGVGFFTTALYMFSIYYGKETQLIGNTWSNMFGILLTNAFSIIGTIMGVKYAAGNNKSSNNSSKNCD